MIRSFIFQASYWTLSVFFAVFSLPLLALPSRAPIVFWIGLYARAMRAAMRHIAGVRVTVRGRENLPKGAFVIAAKHQSWGDGFIMMSEVRDLAFVAGDHLEKFPVVGGILRKLGAVIVDNCGGAMARARLVDREAKRAANEGRPLLIYPEGHLSPAGARHRYRSGVYHLYTAYQAPAIPVATNLGLFWPGKSWRLTPGEAIVDFLPPIPPGLGKEDFMARLETAIETRSLALLGDAAPAGAGLDAPPLPDPAPRRTRPAA